LDEALKDLEMGEGNKFVSLRGSLLDAQGHVRTDIFKPRGDIHLNASGTQIASLRIRQVLETMHPAFAQAPVPGPAPVQAPAPVSVQTPPVPVPTLTAKVQRTRVQAPVSDQAPVVVNGPPAVGAPLVAVVNAPAVAQAPAGVQQLAGQVQDLVIQHVAVQNVPEISTAMEVEDEDTILERLFFKKYGRALPEKEKEKENDVDNIKFVIDLTDEDEMEVATSEVVPVAVVKTEPIEAAEAPVVNVVNVAEAAKRRSFRLERIELAKARKAITDFGKSLRKTDVIPEKEAPLAASNVNTVNVESLTTDEAIEMAEAAIAESDAAIAANQKVIDEFDD
jgi:hypothetical protein